MRGEPGQEGRTKGNRARSGRLAKGTPSGGYGTPPEEEIGTGSLEFYNPKAGSTSTFDRCQMTMQIDSSTQRIKALCEESDSTPTLLTDRCFEFVISMMRLRVFNYSR